MTDQKHVYFFSKGDTDGSAEMKDLLGGKGANLAEMTSIGLPVPPGFTITAEVCNYYSKNDSYPEGMKEQIEKSLKKLEKVMAKKLGDDKDPLLVSVRSGAAQSMPGMMDTVLNLGLNPTSVEGLINMSDNKRFGWDSYRRFIQMFGNVVMGIEGEKFEDKIEEMKKDRGVDKDTELTAEDLKELVTIFKDVYKDETGEDSFPDDPKDQLYKSIDAVFGSWDNPRARKYRKINNITGLLGTAVNVQTMVFGNTGENSATGVAFTRNPSTGENKYYGEYLTNAQGEDVVAGIRTPRQLTVEDSKIWAEAKEISGQERREKFPSLEERMPESFQQLVEIREKLEQHYKDVQDLEFTIQEGGLFILQTRTGKRTGAASVKIAVDMLEEGLIDEKTALRRVEPKRLDELLHPQIDPDASVDVIGKGLPASPGAAAGEIVFDSDDAEKRVANGETVILVRNETSPDDIGGMHAAEGILTAKGGMTSHAAVVARGMGSPCVAGCGDLSINMDARTCRFGDRKYKEGDWITINGTNGEVINGKVELKTPKLTGNFAKIMELSDKYRKLGVRTNADTPEDAEKAREFGAEGIGLCRTEHMFFGEDRIPAMQKMILSDKGEAKDEALEKLLPMQREDFIGIFKAMEGLPVTVRLLDPPLHEFLPHGEKAIKELSGKIGIPAETIKEKAESLSELNPMLGHRGCRLGITFPSISRMQTRAIMEAACRLTKDGVEVYPEIMVPLIATEQEFKNQEAVIREVAEEVIEETGQKVNYKVGTMIEIPRACLVADKVAASAEFFSFGTNDLTQMTLGVSRDDAGKFLPEYVEKNIFPCDPFVALDQEGVGQLVEMAVKRGRTKKKELKVGICGEHGGEPESVKFCHRTGLNYVSCSPYRVPIARLSAAHGALEDE
ncbi:MAG: pyruvate, phosphate dikinase [Elusimicrobiota bacterium]|nr:pyruvate, phosphate dikinase [Elusimicrobiota bacterium]